MVVVISMGLAEPSSASLSMQHICNNQNHKTCILGLFHLSKRLVLVLKEIINFTIQNVSGRFRTVYYTPGHLSWGVFYDNCGKITYSENIYMQGRTIMIAPRKIKHMAEKMERENLEFRTFLKCSAD
ncbi:hypothetical protein ACQRCQ_10285, partial [Lachnospiraceae bacterium SGI.085]